MQRQSYVFIYSIHFQDQSMKIRKLLLLRKEKLFSNRTYIIIRQERLTLALLTSNIFSGMGRRDCLVRICWELWQFALCGVLVHLHPKTAAHCLLLMIQEGRKEGEIRKDLKCSHWACGLVFQAEKPSTASPSPRSASWLSSYRFQWIQRAECRALLPGQQVPLFMFSKDTC